MKRVFASSAFLLVICASSVCAQKAPPPAKEKEQNIIIHKKGDKNEKTTIVIDGDKVTVNGKPVEDFNNGEIEVIENNDSDVDFFPPAAPMPPMPPRGGAKMSARNFTVHQNTAFLGVSTSRDEDGAIVLSVTKNSPAEKAGLQTSDVITKIGSTTIEDADDLVDAIGKYKPEEKVTVSYKRDKKDNTVTVTLEKNKQQNFSWSSDNNHISMNGLKNFSFNWNDNKPRLGLRVQDTENGTGVKVIDVNDDDDSPAAKAGLKEDDIITQVNGKSVQSVKDVMDQIAGIKPGDDVKVTYQRGTATQTAAMHIPKPLQTSDL